MLIFLVPGVMSRIVDYTDSHFIALTDGKVATYSDHDCVIHRTNLTEYENIIEENERIIKELSDSREINMVREQTREIGRMLETLRVHGRSARSIDFLGSALKFVAGTPDHSDLKLIETRMDLLIQNNDKQFIINSAIQDRINELTEEVNSIQNYRHSNTIGQDDLILFELVVMRNGEIMSFLSNLALSMVLARENIVHPAILDNVNFGNKFESGMVPISMKDVLRVSNVSVLQNDSVIFYIIKFPIFKHFCNFLRLFPVAHNNSIIKLETDQAAECHNSVFPVANCIDIQTLKICRETADLCLSQVLSNNSASCSTQSADSVPKVRRVSDGAIILNDVRETDIAEGETVRAWGTLLVTFDTNVTINGTCYQRSGTQERNIIPHPPKTLNIRNVGHENLITLPYIHRLNLENINHIQKLRHDTFVHKIALALLAILTPFMAWLGHLVQKRFKQRAALNLEDAIKEITSKRGRCGLTGGEVNTPTVV